MLIRQYHQGVKMAKHGKKYNASRAKIEAGTYYSPKDALALAKETSTTNFDSTIEVHFRMGLDPRQADQMVRDVVVLPNGLGKTVRVSGLRARRRRCQSARRWRRLRCRQ